MIKFGTRRDGSSHAKFPRGTKRLKTFEGTHLRMRADRWIGARIQAENISRFLHANVGRPVDKVFSEFVERCDKTISNPKETFFQEIEKKEDIGRWGGFYVTNGILNYKKRRKPAQSKSVSYQLLNERALPGTAEILQACRKAKDTQKLVLLGRFYVYDRWYSYDSRLETVYIKPKSMLSFTSRCVKIIGLGDGIDVYTETFNYKPRTKVRFLQRYELEYGQDVYELVIKERKR